MSSRNTGLCRLIGIKTTDVQLRTKGLNVSRWQIKLADTKTLNFNAKEEHLYIKKNSW